MRAAPVPLWVGALTFSRRYRVGTATVCVLTSAVLPRTCAPVVHLTPSADAWMSKSRVFQAAFSPPAPAWRMVMVLIAMVAPRSTCHHLRVAFEHHLSLLPPKPLPGPAFAGFPAAPQEESAVAGLFNAGSPGAGGPVPPSGPA